MKSLFLCAALGLTAPAFATQPFNQSSVTLPGGAPLVKKCDQHDTPTAYTLVIGASSGWQTEDLEARPGCPATLAALDGKNMLHVVLGFTGDDRGATVFDVGDSHHDLVEMKDMALGAGESKSAEWNGVQYRVTRVK